MNAAAIQTREIDLIVIQNRESLRRYVVRILGKRRPDDVADIVQETLCRALAHADTVCAYNDPFAWLCQTAKRIITGDGKNADRSADAVRSDAALSGIGARESAESVRYNPAILELLDQLPERERATIHLRAAGLTRAEIAATLGITESAVREAESRAQQTLRDSIYSAPVSGLTQERYTAALIDRAESLLRETSGFSLNLDGESPQFGYAVSLPGCERKFPIDLAAGIITGTQTTIRQLLAAECPEFLPAGQFWGAWIDNGTLYLDRSIAVVSLDSALILARSGGQLAIWDIVNRETIFTDGSIIRS